MNITIVGPEGSGKRTFIELIKSGLFKAKSSSSSESSEVILSPSKLGIVHFPHQLHITTNPSGSSSLLSQSDLLIIMYDCSNEESYNEVISQYLPLISSHPNHSSHYDTIVIGNKVDILYSTDDDSNIEQQQQQQQLYHFNPSAGLTYISISCKDYYNIASVIKHIINTAVYPTKFLKNNEVLFIKALTRIFHLMADNHTHITKEDLALFHNDIFNEDLDQKQYHSIKSIVSMSNDSTITLDNYITLNQLALQYDEEHLPWGFLRYFDYKNDLTIDLGKENEFLPYKKYAWRIMKEELEKIDMKDDRLFTINESDSRVNMALIKKYFTESTIDMNIQNWINQWNKMSEEDWLTTYLAYLYIGNSLIYHDEDSRYVWKYIPIVLGVGVLSIGAGLIYYIKKHKMGI